MNVTSSHQVTQPSPAAARPTGVKKETRARRGRGVGVIFHNRCGWVGRADSACLRPSTSTGLYSFPSIQYSLTGSASD